MGCDGRTGAPLPADVPTIDVRRLLVWTYHRQRAHVVAGAGLFGEADEPWQARSSLVSTVSRLEAFGGSAGGGSAGHLHVDAERVHEAVMASPRARELVHHAVTLGEPDWMPGAVPIHVQALDRHGRPRMVFDITDRARKHGKPLMVCKLSQADIDRARRRYTEWRDALAALPPKLEGRLVSWRLAGAVPPPEPWRADVGAVFGGGTSLSI